MKKLALRLIVWCCCSMSLACGGQLSSPESPLFGLPKASKPIARTYVWHQELSEEAFSIEVSSDWAIQTGVDRRGSRPEPWYRLTSADAAIEMRAPDATTRAFVTPSRRRADGARIGDLRVRPYIVGVELAAEHASDVARSMGCSQSRVLARRATLAGRATPDVLSAQVSAGQVALSCVRGTQSTLILVEASSAFAPGSSEVWSATTSAMTGPLSRRAEMEAVFARAQDSLVISGAWRTLEGQRAREALAVRRRALRASQRGRRTLGAGT